MTRVLVAEDDRVARDLLGEILRAEGFEVEAVDDGAGAIERARTGQYDLVVSDVRMDRFSGFDVLRAFTERSPGTPVILITAFGDVAGAMEAIQRGAYDYVSKPFNVEDLRQTVTRALERRRLVAEQKAAPADASPTKIEDIVGKSAVMLDVYKLVARVAASTATVLVTGESGTGKELVARAIHNHSPRASAPFVPVNCTALTDSLLESELFGHARGAFTGAVAAKRGLFELASGGTLFLDEIGDMGPKMQAQLLRTLQDGEVRPVGGTESIRVDVRLVCATNRDLEAEVRAGKFREDLYFRINVVTVKLPALRERPGDIPILVAHFLAKLGRRESRRPGALSPAALQALQEYDWPGNVRELENAIDRAVAVAKDGIVLPSDLPPEVTLRRRGSAGGAGAGPAATPGVTRSLVASGAEPVTGVTVVNEGNTGGPTAGGFTGPSVGGTGAPTAHGTGTGTSPRAPDSTTGGANVPVGLSALTGAAVPAGFAVGAPIPVAGPAVPGTIVAVLPVAVGPGLSPTPLPAGAGTPGPRGSLIDDRPSLAELERRYIALTLSECGGNKKRAAEKLGIDRRTLYRALERAGVPPDDTGDDPLDD